MSKDEGERVTVSVVGDVTTRTYAGTFRVKTALSHREKLNQDRVRRELIGTQGGAPEQQALQAAWMLSRLAVRVLDAPTWWTDATEEGVPGLGLTDDNVLAEVFARCMEKDVLVAREMERQAEEARKKLAETPAAE